MKAPVSWSDRDRFAIKLKILGLVSDVDLHMVSAWVMDLGV